MPKLLQTLVPILFLLASTAQSRPIGRIWPTIIFFYHNFSDDSPRTDLTFQGEARIVDESGGSVLRLTEAENEAVGRVLYSPPIQFWHSFGQISFLTSFSFTIKPSQDRTPADGIVFFIAPVGSTPPNGGAGGNLGVFDSSGNGPAIFAVELDTFVNEWDPNYRHIGIDIGSRESRNTTNVGEAIVGQDVTATIEYNLVAKEIHVEVSTGTETFEVSYAYDLSRFLPQQVQVGLSASTGGEVAIHDIHEWEFLAIGMNAPFPGKSSKHILRQFV